MYYKLFILSNRRSTKTGCLRLLILTTAQVELTRDVIATMITLARFDLWPLDDIQVGTESARVTINLCFWSPTYQHTSYPISGFPRRLMNEELPKGKTLCLLSATII